MGETHADAETDPPSPPYAAVLAKIDASVHAAWKVNESQIRRETRSNLGNKFLI